MSSEPIFFATAADWRAWLKAHHATAAELSKEATILLKAAAADSGGTILYEKFGGGAEISSNGTVFNEDSSPRTLARRERAIEELESRGYVKATSERREVFEMTKKGYAAADEVSASS